MRSYVSPRPYLRTPPDLDRRSGLRTPLSELLCNSDYRRRACCARAAVRTRGSPLGFGPKGNGLPRLLPSFPPPDNRRARQARGGGGWGGRVEGGPLQRAGWEP